MSWSQTQFSAILWPRGGLIYFVIFISCSPSTLIWDLGPISEDNASAKSWTPFRLEFSISVVWHFWSMNATSTWCFPRLESTGKASKQNWGWTLTVNSGTSDSPQVTDCLLSDAGHGIVTKHKSSTIPIDCASSAEPPTSYVLSDIGNGIGPDNVPLDNIQIYAFRLIPSKAVFSLTSRIQSSIWNWTEQQVWSIFHWYLHCILRILNWTFLYEHL